MRAERCVTVNFLPYIFWKLLRGKFGWGSEPLLQPVETAADDSDSASTLGGRQARYLVRWTENDRFLPRLEGSVSDVGQQLSRRV